MYTLKLNDPSDNAVDGAQISQCHSQITWLTCRSIRNLLYDSGHKSGNFLPERMLTPCQVKVKDA